MGVKNLIKKILPSFVVNACAYAQSQRAQRTALKKNRKMIKTLLNGNCPIKLELGAGQDRGMEGWTSVDMNDSCHLNLDLTKPLPFPDSSVARIYSSHVLEHFDFKDLTNLLNECLRVLKPGGVFSASVPNARIYIEAYANPTDFSPEKYCGHKPAYNYNSKIDYLNYMAYMDGHHRYMFDEENILIILCKAGLRNARIRAFDNVLDLKERDFQSIYVEAEK